MSSRNTAILCIGSNVDDADARIATVMCKLTALGIKMLRTSGCYRTESADGTGTCYVNCVAEVSLNASIRILTIWSKSVEAAMGRTPDLKDKGIVPIDIDVVMYNGEVLRPKDFVSDYFMTGYMRL